MPARCMRALNDALAPLSLAYMPYARQRDQVCAQRENATKGAKSFYSGLLSTNQRAAYNNVWFIIQAFGAKT